MNAMTCLIVDDEPLALDILENYICRVPNLQLVRRCGNALEAYEYLQDHEVDLLFLDIHMPELTGIDFLRSLSRRPAVIFTTAYPNYALDGYNLDVLDYLLKPIAFDRFLKAVNKAARFVRRGKGEPYRGAEPAGETAAEARDFIFVKADYKMVRVNYNDILYVEGMKDYVKIHVPGQRIVIHQTMKNMEESLPSDRFMRVHRSYIVALHKIEAVDGNMLHVGGAKVPTGASYREELVELLQKYNL